ncbi:hypothetical protein A6A27_36790 [Micromonospora sp. CB01531]|nr:hypothetical protein A6A27_36790 [Micromonospora sp. CB01531]
MPLDALAARPAHASGDHQSQTSTGPGSVSGDLRLPAGFGTIFTSRFIYANGLRQHAVIGGGGPPLLLVHGWPENWYAWRFLMPALARDFTVIAVDQRGIIGGILSGSALAVIASAAFAVADEAAMSPHRTWQTQESPKLRAHRGLERFIDHNRSFVHLGHGPAGQHKHKSN